jgi:tRNA_anti-like
MNKKLKTILITLLILLSIGFASYKYIMTGGARDIQSEDVAFTVNSKDIMTEFTTNSDVASKKYLDKTIEINGIVTGISDTVITIDETISCQFQSADFKTEKEKNITVKGRFVGYDDLLGELKLDQCNISKQ